MKLYHATPAENAEAIMESGISPTDCGDKVNGNEETLQGCDLYGVYGFTSIADAQDFASLNSWFDSVVFEFEAGETDLIDDPEYDGESKFFVTDEPVAAKLITS